MIYSQAFTIAKMDGRCFLKRSGYVTNESSHVISGKMDCFDSE